MMDNIGAIHTSVEKYRMSQVHNTDGARAIQGCHPGMVFEKDVSPHLPHQEAYGKMPQSNTVV
jgi:hypothetical protein